MYSAFTGYKNGCGKDRQDTVFGALNSKTSAKAPSSVYDKGRHTAAPFEESSQD